MDENFCARCHCNPIDEPLTLLTQCITNLEVARNALIDIDEEKSFDMKLMIATHSLKSISDRLRAEPLSPGIRGARISNQQKRTWESKNTITSYRAHLDTCCVSGYFNQTAEAVERK